MNLERPLDFELQFCEGNISLQSCGQLEFVEGFVVLLWKPQTIPIYFVFYGITWSRNTLNTAPVYFYCFPLLPKLNIQEKLCLHYYYSRSGQSCHKRGDATFCDEDCIWLKKPFLAAFGLVDLYLIGIKNIKKNFHHVLPYASASKPARQMKQRIWGL